MIGYVTLGTNDLPGNAKFYDAIAKEMGVGRMMDEDTFIAWGEMGGAPGVAITKPFDGNSPSVGNGTMVALQASGPEQVDRLHTIALEQGDQLADRKSTRLNSSHRCISYAVFCLKKKINSGDLSIIALLHFTLHLT